MIENDRIKVEQIPTTKFEYLKHFFLPVNVIVSFRQSLLIVKKIPENSDYLNTKPQLQVLNISSTLDRPTYNLVILSVQNPPLPLKAKFLL